MINVDATNFNNGGGFGVGGASEKSASINIAENKKNDKASGTSFEGVVVSGGGVDKKAMDQNTYNSLMDEADDVKAQIMQSATNAKMNLKNLFNRLNGADAVQINEDGFNLNDLSDEDCVNIVDRIKIELAAYNENYRAYAGDIDVDKIKEVVGSEGFAQQIAGQMETNGVPATDANITAVSTAVDKLSELESGADSEDGGYAISMDAKLYMTANNSPATLDNVQIAESAYKAGQSGIDENQWNELKPQVENVIRRAGLEVNDANLSNAKALLDEDLPVTEDNLKYMALLDDIDFSAENVAKKTIEAIANGTEPEKAVLTEGKDLYGEVSKALGTLQKLDTTNPTLSAEDNPVSSIINIAQEISDDGIVSLHSLDEAYERYVANPEKYTKNGENSTNSDGGQQSKDSTRVLYEIQILMTAEAGYNLAKNGLDINTVPITTLHENLLAYDKEIFMEELGDQLAHDIDSDEVYSTVYNTREALYDISHAPIDMVGALYKELAYSSGESPVTLMSASTSIKVRLSKASEAYETFESTVRSDLGDSVNRAVEASAGAMLNDMNLEDNRSNREAVSILVKNNMDVNEKNVTNIKELKSTLDSLVENMKPETALNMIRNNINPYTTDIREVNEYLKTENAKLENASGDKYSEFLYKLDRTDGITADERKQYIGIFKMMNMFTNDAGKAIGALVAQGADITMENLVTAYNSRKSYNKMDVSVDDSSDININVYENYYTNLFVATGDKITPNTLKNVNADKPIYERSVENFCEAADDFYDAAAEAAYMDDYMELARQIAAVDESVINELERGGEDITLNNIQAMEELMASDLFNNGFKLDKSRAQDIFDSLDDREKLNEKISALSDETSEALVAEIESDDNTYEVVKTSSISEMAAQMMVRSARREDYTVPYVKADGIGMMKVSFKSDSGETGKISISYEDEALGNVCVNISVGENDFSMSAVYETKRALRGVADQQELDAADAFKEKLESAASDVKDKFNFKSADVIINPVRNVSRNIYNSENSSVSSAALYKIAKTVVEGLV
jgi:hypothetical protein